MSATETRDRHEWQAVAIWAPAGERAIDYVRAPFYRDPDCFSCAHIGPDTPTPDGTYYLFCGHVWDTVWRCDATAITVSFDGRVYTTGDVRFEGRAALARDFAALLLAAADAADAARAR